MLKSQKTPDSAAIDGAAQDSTKGGQAAGDASEGPQPGHVQPTPRQVDYNPPLLTCLSMLFRIAGRPVSMESLKAGIPQSAEGMTVARCIRAARREGMDASTVRRKSVAGISPLVLPCILLLGNGNACVLTDVRDGNATVVFPENSEAPAEIPVEKLDEEYTGLAIFGRLRGRLDKRASELKLLDEKKWFWGTLRYFMPIYRHVALASVVINLMIIATPVFVMNVYDRVVPNNAVETLWVLALGVSLIYLFDFLLRNLRSYFLDAAGKNADVIIAGRLMRRLMAMKLEYKPDSAGSLANNMREFESLRDFFSSTTFQSLIDLPFLVLFIVIIWYIGGELALVPAFMVPVILLVGAAVQYPFQRVIEDGYREATQKNALLVEIISGLEAIKTSCAEGRMQHLWERVVGLSSTSNRKSRALANFSITLSMLATQVVSVLLIIWGVYLISEGRLTMGGLIACNILAGRAMAPLGAVAAMLTRLQQSRMALKSLNLLMEIPSERPEGESFFEYGQLEPSITFEDVVFSYPEAANPALSDVKLRIGRGERVGIIGPMGSGKTTLGRLIVGLYHCGQGIVKIGDVDINQIDVADLRRNIGYVSQDNFLFYGTVRDNIALGLPDIDDLSVQRAAVLAGCMEFISRHPAGFGMSVGERGTALSGGQRQSVAIARALLFDPDILVLDEPSSNMDHTSEARLKRRLAQITADRTLVLITHRMSMLELVDKLVVLDQGRVMAYGPKDEVIAFLKKGKEQAE